MLEKLGRKKHRRVEKNQREEIEGRKTIELLLSLEPSSCTIKERKGAKTKTGRKGKNYA